MLRLVIVIFLALLGCHMNVFADDFSLDGGIFKQPEDANMTDANFTYKANPMVEAFHRLPHFASDGTIINEPQFFSAPSIAKSPDDIKKATDYKNSILPFPIFLGCLGVLAIVFLELGINDFCTWLIPKQGPKELDPDDETITAIALYTHANEVSRKNWLMYFCIALSIAFLGTNFMWYGQVVSKKKTHVTTFSTF